MLGGKAAQLNHLFPHYPIPPGFCLPVAAFEQWVADDGPAHLPAGWEAQVAQAYQQLAVRTQTAQPTVVVRSSAVGEDSQTASFAGLYESYLNIVGVELLYTSILACWGSAFGEPVYAYHQTAQNQLQLGVLVQLMLAADIAMVAFSQNPINHQAEVVINANWGLGQSLVDGSTTPDTYIVRPSDYAIIQISIGSKAVMTIRAATGVKQVPTPRPIRAKAVLTEAQMREVAQLALQLEGETGWPVDIEAVYAQNKLYLLQCRPITT